MGIALLLVAGAGLSTTIGSLLGLMVKKPGPKFMSFTLGFSAGILILTAFVELLGGVGDNEKDTKSDIIGPVGPISALLEGIPFGFRYLVNFLP